MGKKTNDIIISSIILVISTILLLSTPGQIEEPLMEILMPVLPYLLPVFALSMIILLSAGLLLVQIFNLKRISINETPSLFDKSKLRLIPTLIILFSGVYAVNIVGFITTSGLITGLLLVLFGARNWKAILILTIATPLFIYVFFEEFMKIPLPEGIIFIVEG